MGLRPYIWPSARRDLKIRVGIAMFLLLLANFATLAVPFPFKWATYALARAARASSRRAAVGGPPATSPSPPDSPASRPWMPNAADN